MAASQRYHVVGFTGNFANVCVRVCLCVYVCTSRWTHWLHSRAQPVMLVSIYWRFAHRAERAEWPLHSRERAWAETITVINCNDWGWKWVFRGLWRGWGPRWTNQEDWHAACRPLPALVIVPMCSALGCIPWGTAHTGGHLKAYLDVAAIGVRKSTQGSNLFQLLERARGWGNRDETLCACVCVCCTLAYLCFSNSRTHLRHRLSHL